MTDDETDRLIRGAAAGDEGDWKRLVQSCHGRLRRMVAVRLDPRLAGRIDPSDVLQDVYLQATERLPEFVDRPEMPFFLWLRLITGDRINRLHRYHLGTQSRDARKEVSLFCGPTPEASSASMAAQLIGDDPSPGESAVRAERFLMLRDALGELEPVDREVLSLRHFEQLTSAEAAQVLGISQAAVAKRYFRAVKRLRTTLGQLPGGQDEDGEFDA